MVSCNRASKRVELQNRASKSPRLCSRVAIEKYPVSHDGMYYIASFVPPNLPSGDIVFPMYTDTST